ncbi:uncharacterized protein LOC127789774 isoform X2 [Diospyros lotus]|uniref:uncharacterized protein LOC127789774 isoform X2 n=1 Tax=Diospyros lotus TaxID=55363 RepID=UPI0022555A90|nr:uncharacterized protein LOC127789774 isoform X2 [Diospyros lotus]
MAVRLSPCVQHHFSLPSTSNRCPGLRRLSVRSSISTPNEFSKLVMDVKEKLEKDHHSLPLGKNGRDDEDMILWFLKDRKFAVEDAVSKLAKAIKWRHEFGVSELSEESVRSVAETGKAFVHDFLDVYERPVLIVVASKHFPAFDVFYNYYPKRLGEVLFVEAPFVFRPIWQLAKPLLKSYASLVRFCSVAEVRKEYFTESTIPTIFRD